MTAEIVSKQTSSKKLPLISGCLCILSLAFFIYLARNEEAWFWNHRYIMDGLAGFTTSCFLLWCKTHGDYCRTAKIRPSLWLQIVESPTCVKIGLFSYSLYLLHFPIVSLLYSYVLPMHLTVDTTMFLMVTLGLFFSLVVSHIFYLLVERHFVSSKPKHEKVFVEGKVIAH